MTATEKRLQDIKKKRTKVEDIVRAALEDAINEGLKLENYVEWRGSREEYATAILDIWIKDEDGDLAIDRLVTLIIH